MVLRAVVLPEPLVPSSTRILPAAPPARRRPARLSRGSACARPPGGRRGRPPRSRAPGQRELLLDEAARPRPPGAGSRRSGRRPGSAASPRSRRPPPPPAPRARPGDTSRTWLTLPFRWMLKSRTRLVTRALERLLHHQLVVHPDLQRAALEAMPEEDVQVARLHDARARQPGEDRPARPVEGSGARVTTPTARRPGEQDGQGQQPRRPRRSVKRTMGPSARRRRWLGHGCSGRRPRGRHEVVQRRKHRRGERAVHGDPRRPVPAVPRRESRQHVLDVLREHAAARVALGGVLGQAPRDHVVHRLRDRPGAPGRGRWGGAARRGPGSPARTTRRTRASP